MTDPATSKINPWYTVHAFLSHKLTILQVIANLAQVNCGSFTSHFTKGYWWHNPDCNMLNMIRFRYTPKNLIDTFRVSY